MTRHQYLQPPMTVGRLLLSAVVMVMVMTVQGCNDRSLNAPIAIQNSEEQYGQYLHNPENPLSAVGAFHNDFLRHMWQRGVLLKPRDPNFIPAMAEFWTSNTSPENKQIMLQGLKAMRIPRPVMVR